MTPSLEINKHRHAEAMPRPFDANWAQALKNSCKKSSAWFLRKLGAAPLRDGDPFPIKHRLPNGKGDELGVSMENFAARHRDSTLAGVPIEGRAWGEGFLGSHGRESPGNWSGVERALCLSKPVFWKRVFPDSTETIRPDRSEENDRQVPSRLSGSLTLRRFASSYSVVIP